VSLGIKEIESHVFWENLSKKAEAAKIPFKASFELTYNCNLRCRHCYVVQNSRRKELSYDEVCFILDQLAREGCFHLNITGGEPLTRPDFSEILTYAKKKGFYLILLTNGTLVTPEIADCLKDSRINQVDISLYGMTEDTYESITQVPGSFQRCLQGINLLHDRNIPIFLKMTVMNLNIEEFDDVKNFAKRLEVPFRYGYFVHPKSDGSKEPLAFRLSPEEGIKLEMINHPHLFEQKKGIEKGNRAASRNNGLFYCNAGRNSLAITPYGELNICLEYHFPKYDLRRGNIAQGWKELVNYVKSTRPTAACGCGNCELVEFCQWCPAEGYLNEGDKNTCVPYFKELARIKKELIEKEK